MGSSAPAGVEGILEGSVLVGCALYRVVFEGDLYFEGFSYKPFKSLVALGSSVLGAIPPGPSLEVSASPLIEAPAGGPGRILGTWRPGWLMEWRGPRGGVRIGGGGSYYLRVSWVGPSGEDRARALGEALEAASGLARVELVEWGLERVEAPFTHEALLALASPAQFKIVGWDGLERVLSHPDPARLLAAPLKALNPPPDAAREARAALNLYTAQTGGEWRRVTVYIDRRRPTNWALTGWARLTLTRQAPEWAGRLLGLLQRLALYTGVGKSRLEGLGLAGEPLDPKNKPELLKAPCMPWPLKAAGPSSGGSEANAPGRA